MKVSFGTNDEKAISLSKGIKTPSQVNEHINQHLNQFDLRQHLTNTANSLLEKSVDESKVLQIIESISSIAVVTSQLQQADAMLGSLAPDALSDFVDEETLNINGASINAPQPGLPNRDVRMSILDELNEAHSDLFVGSKGEVQSLISEVAMSDNLESFCQLVETNFLGPKYQRSLLQDYVSTLSNEQVQKLTEQNELTNTPKPTPH